MTNNTTQTTLIQEFRKAAATGSIGGKPMVISPALIESVLNQMSENRFINAAHEAGQEGELSWGYDVYTDGSYKFYENNKTLLLDLVKSIAGKNSDRAVSKFIYQCIDTDIFSATQEHSDAIISNSAEANSKILEGDSMVTVENLPTGHTKEEYDACCMRDAYESVTYQLGAHAVMQACKAFNDYQESLVETSA